MRWLWQTYDYDWAAPNAKFRRAIELDPRYVQSGHYWYGNFLKNMRSVALPTR
jgi:hypothetical protein